MALQPLTLSPLRIARPCHPTITRRSVAATTSCRCLSSRIVDQRVAKNYQCSPKSIHRRHCEHIRRYSSSKRCNAAVDGDGDDGDDWILRLENARLCYPEWRDDGRSPLSALNLSIRSPSINLKGRSSTSSRRDGDSAGGHALLGANAAGKSLLISALMAQASTTSRPGGIDDGSTITLDNPFLMDPSSLRYRHSSPSVTSVSFESHQEVLKLGGSVNSVLTFGTGQNLTKAAQFLVVRFGLYPFLTRNVATLSTGEIRKVLLIRALTASQQHGAAVRLQAQGQQQPRLLILDNALDGLDVPSRAAINDIISKTIQGFRADILVQGVDVKSVVRSQVLLATHRAEEIVDAISTVTFLKSTSAMEPQRAVTESRQDRSGQKLLIAALGSDSSALEPAPWEDTQLPTKQQIADLWQSSSSPVYSKSPATLGQEIIRFTNVTVTQGEKALLSELDWTVRQGERWLVAGGNGAGKSSLSKILIAAARHDDAFVPTPPGLDGHAHVSIPSANRIGWVSTELHLSMSHSKRTALDVLQGVRSESSPSTDATSVSVPNVVVASDIAQHIATMWMRLDRYLLTQPFASLSQGEQKLILVAAALARRPDSLILDEPLQGLDALNRRLVLGLVERICQATPITFIYVTHHFDELIPSLTNVLHLKDGRSTYNGNVAAYNPNEQ